MSEIDEGECWVPEHVREYLRGLGFVLPLEAAEGYIRNWHAWMLATGDFCDCRDTDTAGITETVVVNALERLDEDAVAVVGLVLDGLRHAA